MATIKSYTTIEQSRKLAEILPLESADMCYRYYSGGMITGYGDCVLAKSFITGKNVIRENDLPCWSLAALLEQLPYELCDDDGNSAYLQMNKEDDVYQLVYTSPYEDFESIETDMYDDFVDACYEMVIILKEQNLL